MDMQHARVGRRVFIVDTVYMATAPANSFLFESFSFRVILFFSLPLTPIYHFNFYSRVCRLDMGFLLALRKGGWGSFIKYKYEYECFDCY